MRKDWEDQFTFACDQFAQTIRELSNLEEDLTEEQAVKLKRSLESIVELRKILIASLKEKT